MASLGEAIPAESREQTAPSSGPGTHEANLESTDVQFQVEDVWTSQITDLDGTLDQAPMHPDVARGPFTPAIFVHAGAGFHSYQNERIHLQACNDASLMGMKFLNAGATATEAVEAALRILEDKEITNAGYGSNLSIDGTVECDATVVDHLGRSGACGAVPNIKNPISLAKLILDQSYQPLSLRRVPPNALVGVGARDFARDHGLAVLPNEYLISKNARDRYLKWQADLQQAEIKLREAKFFAAKAKNATRYRYVEPMGSRAGSAKQGDHANAIQTGVWNEGQPDSPSFAVPDTDVPDTLTLGAKTPHVPNNTPSSSPDFQQKQAVRGTLIQGQPAGKPDSRSPGYAVRQSSRLTLSRHEDKLFMLPAALATRQETTSQDGTTSPALSPNPLALSTLREFAKKEEEIPAILSRGIKRPFPTLPANEEEDVITDTVGAIAIDTYGRIAAASSSGGIGMKHRGRLGPAALVGIGTAVVPCRAEDDQGITVAAVASGTGEHMATTMASQRCAERLYNGTRQGPSGEDVAEDDEDAIMESFIRQDFMNHPGVKGCNSVGAIGMMAVKQSQSAYYLYFAHNTDSFAIASMGGKDKQPIMTMSRLGDGRRIARGGRRIRAS